MIFGENLLALLVLAIGAALAFGNLMALLRPRSEEQIGEDELARPPLARSVGMIVLGLIAAIWALASLITAENDAETPAAAPLSTAAEVGIDSEPRWAYSPASDPVEIRHGSGASSS